MKVCSSAVRACAAKLISARQIESAANKNVDLINGFPSFDECHDRWNLGLPRFSLRPRVRCSVFGSSPPCGCASFCVYRDELVREGYLKTVPLTVLMLWNGYTSRHY